MITRLHTQSGLPPHSLAQSLMPDFREGSIDERLSKMSKWAGVHHPFRRWTLDEIAEVTGVGRNTVIRAEKSAYKKIHHQLETLKNEWKPNT